MAPGDAAAGGPAGFRVSAPVRVCDLGGWTDTWFGQPGRVLNFAVGPAVTVEVRTGAGAGDVELVLADLGEQLTVAGADQGRPPPVAARPHPLLQAAVARIPPPADTRLRLRISSAVPPGAATGTSAAVVVAVLCALAEAAGQAWDARGLAGTAHLVETADLGLQSGVQDQLAAAHGGINWVRIDRYPVAHVERLPSWPDLDQHLTVFYLGHPHRSSAVHQEVIAAVGTRRGAALDALRTAAETGRRAVIDRDVAGLARAMVANTEAQAALHPSLVSAEAATVIDTARRAGAWGWKVNGAGGEGGSLSFLSPDEPTRRAVEAAAAGACPAGRVLRLALSAAGVSVAPMTGPTGRPGLGATG